MKKIAFLISGKGSHIENMVSFLKRKKLNASINLIIASTRNTIAENTAREFSIPYVVISYKKWKDNLEVYSEKISQTLFDYKIDLALMAGFLSLYIIPKEFEYRIMNIHPSLIPSFSGKGFYGEHVFKKVLDYGVKVTGATVHFVNNSYDEGPIILQEVVYISADETVFSLKEKVFNLEKNLYSNAVELFLKNRIKVENRKVEILS